jgi:hypothetical protein
MHDLTTPKIQLDRRRPSRPLWRAGALATLEAAVGTELVGALGRAAGVPLRVGRTHGASIHVVFPSFAFSTVVSGLAGTLLAIVLAKRSRRPVSAFLKTSIAITLVSLLLPTLIGGATIATRMVLASTHLVAAAIIIPQLATKLRLRGRSEEPMVASMS